MPGTLYVVATPIGNLEDITLRALRILKSVQCIACEDTRVTQHLLARHQIETPTIAFHAHSSEERVTQILDRLEAGEDVALVSDAGTPTVSDPGEALVVAAIARSFTVVPLPGACAQTTALAVSGLPTRFVLFLGFLPRTDSEQLEILGAHRSTPYTLVVYESPRRLQDTLRNAARALGDRRAMVARELTKKFETFERGRLLELMSRFDEAPLGEITLVIGPAEQTEAPALDEAQVDAEAKAMLAKGMRPADVAKALALTFGLARQEAYARVIALRDSI